MTVGEYNPLEPLHEEEYYAFVVSVDRHKDPVEYVTQDSAEEAGEQPMKVERHVFNVFVVV